jgi:hypothetical protein
MVSVEVPLDTLASDGALCNLLYGLPPQANLCGSAAVHGPLLGLKLVLLRLDRSMEVRNDQASFL